MLMHRKKWDVHKIISFYMRRKAQGAERKGMEHKAQGKFSWQPIDKLRTGWQFGPWSGQANNLVNGKQ